MAYVSAEKELVYSQLFANKNAYSTRKVKPHSPVVSKLGIMEKPGKIQALTGSLNFARKIDASKPSLATMYTKPSSRVTNDTEIDTTPIPKNAKQSRSEYDYDKVLAQRGKDSYNKAELIFWYHYFTGITPPRGLSQARLRELHAELDVNKGKSDRL